MTVTREALERDTKRRRRRAAVPSFTNPHEVEADEARRSNDPAQIRALYANYGRQLREFVDGREDELTQHGSERVARWQSTNLPRLSSPTLTLDLGCGPLPNVAFGLATPGRTIVCADISFDIVALARMLAEARQAPGLAFVVADAERLPFETGAFDMVTADDVIEHVPEPTKLVQECSRVVSSDGLVSISTPNRRAISVIADRAIDMMRGEVGPPEKYFLVASHLREYTRTELRRLCGIHFRSVAFAGVGWDGRSLLKRFVSRITTLPGMKGITRHWIVLLRKPAPTA